MQVHDALSVGKQYSVSQILYDNLQYQFHTYLQVLMVWSYCSLLQIEIHIYLPELIIHQGKERHYAVKSTTVLRVTERLKVLIHRFLGLLNRMCRVAVMYKVRLHFHIGIYACIKFADEVHKFYLVCLFCKMPHKWLSVAVSNAKKHGDFSSSA